MLELLALLPQCAPTVAHETMAAVVNVESSKNPYAIGVVGGRLARQPRNLDEAVATARQLEANGWNFSLGVAQVNRYNLPKYQLTYEKAFEPCANLRAGSKILEDCYVRALRRTPEPDKALQAALSCYYSGNFTRGFAPDVAGKPSYVQKVWLAAGGQATAIPVVPSIRNVSDKKPQATPAARQGLVTPTPDGDAPVRLKAEQSASASGEPSRRRAPPGSSPDKSDDTEDALQAEPRSSSVVVF